MKKLTFLLIFLSFNLINCSQPENRENGFGNNQYELNEKLLNAVKSGSFKQVNDCLQAFKKDFESNSSSAQEMIKAAVNYRDPNYINPIFKVSVLEYSRTPLHYAVEINDLAESEKIAQLLLDNGAVKYLKADKTPLFLAAAKGRITLVKILLEGGYTDICDLNVCINFAVIWQFKHTQCYPDCLELLLNALSNSGGVLYPDRLLMLLKIIECGFGLNENENQNSLKCLRLIFDQYQYNDDHAFIKVFIQRIQDFNENFPNLIKTVNVHHNKEFTATECETIKGFLKNILIVYNYCQFKKKDRTALFKNKIKECNILANDVCGVIAEYSI